MPDDVVKLRLNDKEVVLVGTAHISQKSIETVEKVIEDERPDVVAVELCEQREHAIRDEKKWDETEITEVVRTGRTHLFMAQLWLTNFQRKLGENMGIKPGSEMVKAMDIARKNNIKIELVDRDIKVTLKRALDSMTLKEKAIILYGLASSIFGEEEVNEKLIEELKEKDVLTKVMEELSKEIPSIKKVLVDERDRYIAYRIADVKAKKVVAVVGAGHVEGIKRNLESTPDADGLKKELRELEVVSERKSRLKYAGYLIPITFAAILGLGFYSHGIGLTLNMLAKWFLVSGSLSALGVALACGHPLSILSAFVAAPFTLLHPALAVGWVAGAVELKLRKPLVKDFKGLLTLRGIGDWWKNRITRTLLVIAFANLGGTIGTLIALPYLATLL